MSPSKEELEESREENEIIAQRRLKLAQLREKGNPFPNDFRRDALAAEIHSASGHKSKEELAEESRRIAVAGRIVLKRVMGRASFVTLQDGSGRIQLYIRKNDLPEGVYDEFRKWDLGDIVGGTGLVMKTNMGELSIQVDELRLLTKSLRPLPEKFRGLADREARYRQRYLDLIANEETRTLFLIRSKTIDVLRRFLLDRQFLEVETPMMLSTPGGATAAPFTTHYNSLDTDMYLRVAPELNLKRLVVGGFERVFEINRNFRNEGISTKHSPEFTMLEFYQAYADYKDMIALTEEMLRAVAEEVVGSSTVVYAGKEIDFAKPFERYTLFESILAFNPGIDRGQLADFTGAQEIARELGIEVQNAWGLGKLQMEIFEHTVEERLEQPTVITGHPIEVSPLARRSDTDPALADRFEIFVMGKEVCNGFSELNDPEDQAARFRDQVVAKEAGDEEAMHFDGDYVTALEYGLPPTAGEGLGIDRLVMLLTDSASIRDVVLFPHLRPKS